MTVFMLFYWDLNVLFLLEWRTLLRDFGMMVNKIKNVIMTVFLLFGMMVNKVE